MIEHQPPLWAAIPPDELGAMLDRAREQWRLIRFQHAIGSQEEQAAWELYRQTSDAYWEMLRST